MEKTRAIAALVDRAVALAAELGFELHDAATGGMSDANTIAATGDPVIDGLGPVGGDDHAPAEWLDLDQRRAAHGAACRTDRASVSARDGWLDDLHPEAYRTPGRGRARDPVHRSPRRALDEPLHEPADRARPRVLGEEWSRDPELWLKQLHPDDRDRALDDPPAVQRGREPYLDEYRILTKDGRTLWIRDEACPVLSEDGSTLFWRGVMLDITERKEAEDKLRWSLEVLRRTLQQRRELAQRLEQRRRWSAGRSRPTSTTTRSR